MTTERAHLAGLREMVEEIDAAVLTLVAGLTPAQLLWRPAPERWGIADCLEHLVATGDAYLPRVAAAIAAAPLANGTRDYRPTWFGRWFVRASSPGGRAIRTRGPFVPPPAKADAPSRFLAQQGIVRRLLADAAGHDLRAVRIHSPLMRLITLRLGETLELLVMHERRHLEQAEHVRRETGFPVAMALADAAPPRRDA